jgi:hypothetical protein
MVRFVFFVFFAFLRYAREQELLTVYRAEDGTEARGLRWGITRHG